MGFLDGETIRLLRGPWLPLERRLLLLPSLDYHQGKLARALHEGVTVKEALEAFEKTRFRVLPVVDDNQRIVGAVTMEDIGNVDSRQMEELLSDRLMH